MGVDKKARAKPLRLRENAQPNWRQHAYIAMKLREFGMCAIRIAGGVPPFFFITSKGKKAF